MVRDESDRSSYAKVANDATRPQVAYMGAEQFRILDLTFLQERIVDHGSSF